MILNVWVAADFRCGEHNMHRRVKYERKFPQHTLTTFFVWARIYFLQPYCSRGRLAPRSSFSKYYLQSRCGWYCVHILHCVAMPCFLLFCLFLLFSCTMSLWWVCEIGFKKFQGIRENVHTDCWCFMVAEWVQLLNWDQFVYLCFIDVV